MGLCTNLQLGVWNSGLPGEVPLDGASLQGTVKGLGVKEWPLRVQGGKKKGIRYTGLRAVLRKRLAVGSRRENSRLGYTRGWAA